MRVIVLHSERRGADHLAMADVLRMPAFWGVLVPLTVVYWLLVRALRRALSVRSLHRRVHRGCVDAMGRVNVVERTNSRVGRRTVLRVHLTVHLAEVPPYDAWTRCVHDADIARLLAIADSGQLVPLLVSSRKHTLVVLDPYPGRLVREGLAVPSAVVYR
jgi:hypothetical protein